MTKKTAHPGNLYLPMEIFVREYDSRLLIAMMAIERGMNVVIGQKWLMEKNIKSMPRGLWIFKTMTLRDSGVMKKVKQAGHCIASIDEEVATFAEGSGGLLWVSEAAVAFCDRIFCIGSEHERSLAAKWPIHACKTRRTGNPRWDYLRTELSSVYAEQAAKYRSQHGPIILVNTNAGEINSAKYRGKKDAMQRYIERGKLDVGSKEKMELWEDYVRFAKSNLKAILELIPSLAEKFPDHAIVVRPHPSENIGTYRTAFAGNDRIKVIFDGPAAAWVVASDVLIHTSCTTGIEAYSLARPAISYETISSAWNTILLPGQLNMKAGSESDVIQLVSRVLADALYWPSFMQGKQTVFHRFFDGSTGPLASENIIEQCSSLLDELNLQDANSGGEWRSRFGFLPWWYLSKNNRRLFPSLNATDVAERIAMLSRRLGRDLHPCVTKIGDRLFKVSAADTPGASR